MTVVEVARLPITQGSPPRSATLPPFIGRLLDSKAAANLSAFAAGGVQPCSLPRLPADGYNSTILNSEQLTVPLDHASCLSLDYFDGGAKDEDGCSE
jgi:hypothetical protein